MDSNNYSGLYPAGDEVEIIGKVVPKKAKKTLIGEAQPYQPKSREKPGSGVTYVIGDPRSLDFWEAMEGDLDEVELNYDDDE